MVRTSHERRRGAILLTAGVLLAGAAWAVDAPSKKKAPTVRLIVDYGDGVEKHFTALPYKKGNDGMTVLDALGAAKASPHGITFDSRGRGAYTMLTRIDDLKNGGAGADAKNWTYRVNDKFAEDSLGVHVIQAGDEVRWTYAKTSDAFKNKQ
jgi:hypothetical protein